MMARTLPLESNKHSQSYDKGITDGIAIAEAEQQLAANRELLSKSKSQFISVERHTPAHKAFFSGVLYGLTFGRFGSSPKNEINK